MILEKLYFPFISSIIAKTLIQAKTTQFDCTNKTKYKYKHQNILEGYFLSFLFLDWHECGGCVADFLISCLSPGTDCCKLKVSVNQLGSIILRFAPTSHQSPAVVTSKTKQMFSNEIISGCVQGYDRWLDRSDGALSPSPQNNTAKNIYSPGNDSFFACPDFSYK